MSRAHPWVYGIQSGEFIKVGVAGDIPARMRIMRLYNPHKVKVVMRRQVFEPYSIERRIHKLLANKAIGREWFSATVEEVRRAADQACQENESRRKAYGP